MTIGIYEILDASGNVINTINSDLPYVQSLTEHYRFLGSVYTPPAPAPIVEAKKITKLAFLARFTDQEAIMVDLASQGLTVEAASMRRYLNKVNAATFIDLESADISSGIQALETVGLLDASRAQEILNNPVHESERYTG
jgi:hypothetical protein